LLNIDLARAAPLAQSVNPIFYPYIPQNLK
jgi:hypothetical protein